MLGLMQEYPLTLVHLFERAQRLFADNGIATAGPNGLQRTTTLRERFAEVAT